MQIVFADIAAYSRRRSYAQVGTILALTECFGRAIEATASSYSAQMAPMHAHLQHDVVVLPTGDGIAVAFPFDNLPGLSMDFVDNLIAEVDAHNTEQDDCAEFYGNGYCDCHTLLQLRTGVSEGATVLYEDFNGQLNIAGNPVSQAAQVRNFAEPAQVFLTDNAHQTLINHVRGREQQFRSYPETEMQDGTRVNLHQYVNGEIPGLNVAPRAHLEPAGGGTQPEDDEDAATPDASRPDDSPGRAASRRGRSPAKPASKMTMVPLQDLGLSVGDGDHGQAERFFSRPFLISSRLVTQDDYKEVMGRNPSYFVGGSCPVEMVSWFDAVEFCNELSIAHRLEPVYEISGEQVDSDPARDGYRLPTETEWEHCCRGELDGADRYGPIDEIAWYSANSEGGTHPVGELKPNRGIYDLLGNVWEWCGDWYQREPPAEPQVDYGGPPTGFERALRGGSWSDLPRSITAVDRHRAVPSERHNTIGFRVARTQLAKSD
jgi:formylglycine-generating enzyme required for sulfatase activity/class 3 adenylate cyclase